MSRRRYIEAVTGKSVERLVEAGREARRALQVRNEVNSRIDDEMSRDPRTERYRSSRGSVSWRLTEDALWDIRAIDLLIKRNAEEAAAAAYKETVEMQAEYWLPVIEQELVGIDPSASQDDFLWACRDAASIYGPNEDPGA